MIISKSIAVLPQYVFTNKELAKICCLTHEAPSELDLARTAGVFERRYFRKPDLSKIESNRKNTECLSELSLRFVGREALQTLDMLVHCSTTPSGVSPATAHRLHHLAQLPSTTHCLDLMSSCSSFLSAVKMCEALVSHSNQSCLIIASELKSQHLSFQDKVTAGIFADGCCAYDLRPGHAILQGQQHTDRFFWAEPSVDSSLVSNISVERHGENDILKISCGKLMYRKTVQALSDMVERCINVASQKNMCLHSVYMHQANAHILSEVRRKFPGVRIPILISDIGNLVSASMPVHRIRCLLLDSLFADFERLGQVNLLFNRMQALEAITQNPQKFSLQVGSSKERGLYFRLAAFQEEVTIYDAAASGLHDSWLSRISDEEWHVYFEDCVKYKASSYVSNRPQKLFNALERQAECDAWIVAGGGFQALGLVHLRVSQSTKAKEQQ